MISTAVATAHPRRRAGARLGTAWCIAAAVGCIAGTAAAVEPTTEIFKLIPADGEAFDRFGRSVAVEGTVGLIGAPLDDDRDDAAGAAYLFDLRTGRQTDKLLAVDPPTGELFGQRDDNVGDAVALAGGSALIGALQKDEAGNFAGAAYRFAVQDGTGQQVARRFPFSPPPFSPDGSAFGAAVALSSAGSRMMVGAPGDTGEDDAGANGGGGAAYLFPKPGAPGLKVFASDAAFADNFGTAVAIADSAAVASSPFDDDNGSSSGAVYVLDPDTGAERMKLTPADGERDDFFGLSVAVAGNTLAVGAPFDDDAGPNAGAVYLYDVDTGMLRQKLTPPAGTVTFGFALALDRRVLAVGGDGEAFVYDAVTGRLLARLRPSDPAPEQFFGTAIAVSDLRVLVGAEGDATNGERSGAAYVFTIPSALRPAATSIAAIEPRLFIEDGQLGARVIVTVLNDLGLPAANATVSLELKGDLSGRVKAVTDRGGQALLRSPGTAPPPVSYTACVTAVDTQPPYRPEDNAQTCATR
ncbi:MAG: hypothetical protein AAGD86_09470 [Pseudomonadota bacterium]